MQETGNNYINNKSLSIRLSADGFSFFVHKETGEQSFFTTSYPIDPIISIAANLKCAIENLPILKESYSRIQVLVDSKTTFIPFERFEEDQAEELYLFNYPSEKGKSIKYDILPKSNTAILYCIDKSVHQLLDDHYPSALLHTVESPVIEHFAEKAKRTDTRKLFVYFHDRAISMYAFDNSKLIFTNSFRTSNVNDDCYYILHVWQSLHFDQQKEELHIVGGIRQKTELLSNLHKFIRQVYVINPAAEFNRSIYSITEGCPYDIQTLLSIGI